MLDRTHRSRIPRTDTPLLEGGYPVHRCRHRRPGWFVLRRRQDQARCPTVTGSTDANGWRVDYEATGKRVWRKRWLAVATTAAADAAVVSAAALPVGVSTHAAVHFDSVTCRLSANSGRVNVTVEGAEGDHYPDHHRLHHRRGDTG